ncbi:hypothetical protein [Ornithinimicrobium murale]|uniref:hypothetical protein n=1 Tax=Ornithinimicrobium murale TaxID=1050153 RepID=UPI000E0D6C92|nr:hypothetical protein [Ornithinimicrobium murale]
MPAWHEATWVDDPDAAPRRKRRWRTAWLWLLILPVGLFLFSIARFNNYWQYDDYTVATFACEQPLAETATWSDMEAAGCRQAAIPGTEVKLLDGGAPAEEFESDGTTWTFPNLPSAFSTMGLNVLLEESAGRVFIVDASTTPPAVHREMSPSDVDRTVFARSFGAIDSTEFYAVVAPPE